MYQMLPFPEGAGRGKCGDATLVFGGISCHHIFHDLPTPTPPCNTQSDVVIAQTDGDHARSDKTSINQDDNRSFPFFSCLHCVEPSACGSASLSTWLGPHLWRAHGRNPIATTCNPDTIRQDLDDKKTPTSTWTLEIGQPSRNQVVQGAPFGTECVWVPWYKPESR